MIMLELEMTVTSSLSSSLKYLSHDRGNVTAKEFPTLMIFLVSSCGKFVHHTTEELLLALELKYVGHTEVW